MSKQQTSAQAHEQRIAAMFDKIARRYDMLNRLLSCWQDVRWRKHLVAEIPANTRLLDVATGSGDVIYTCLQSGKQLPFCVGIDISSEMLAVAKQKLPDTVSLQKMSAERMSFTNASFDTVSIAFGLRNVSNPEQTLIEFRRVLAMKGKLLLLEFFAIEHSIFAKIFSFYLHNILPRVASLFSDKSSYSYLPTSIANFQHADALQKLAGRCGFTLIKRQKFLAGAVQLLVFTKT